MCYVCYVSSASVHLVRLRLLCLFVSSASVVSVHLVRLCLLRLSVFYSVRLVSFNILNDSSGSIVYLPIHSNALNSISLKRLSGSTCLTEPFLSGVFGVFGVFEVFKGVRLVQRFYSYNTLSKSHNSFSCPYRRNRTI